MGLTELSKKVVSLQPRPKPGNVGTGTLTIPSEIESVVLIEDGILYVVDTEMRNPGVRSFASLAQRGRHVRRVERLDARQFNARRTNTIRESGAAADTVVLEDVSRMLKEAGEAGVSDIHIRIETGYAEVYYRINGMMVMKHRWLEGKATAFCATIYGAMADIADPIYNPGTYQDARLSNPQFLPPKLHGVRVSSAPSATGSLMVMRLLYASTEEGSGSMDERLAMLGYTDEDASDIKLMRAKPTGINIVAGPTGSGKSTTMKHILEAIHRERPDLNILSVEDPPEYPIDGVVQIPVTNAPTEEERRKAFTAAIRAAMRLDPDIIMIGEIRDAESAQLALRAAMTGHQVWTTLHANSAWAILTRLANILDVGVRGGTAMNLLDDATILTGLVFQRLGKVLCDHCKVPLQQRIDEFDTDFIARLREAVEIDNHQVYVVNPDGCEHCERGIRGRTVVSEVVVTNPTLLELASTQSTEAARRHWLANGGRTARENGLAKVQDGQIDPRLLEEIVGPLSATDF